MTFERSVDLTYDWDIVYTVHKYHNVYTYFEGKF